MLREYRSPQPVRVTKKYSFWKFIGDILMTCITGGFWLIWIFCREMRKAR